MRRSGVTWRTEVDALSAAALQAAVACIGCSSEPTSSTVKTAKCTPSHQTMAAPLPFLHSAHPASVSCCCVVCPAQPLKVCTRKSKTALSIHQVIL
jgi:hypothetical protein